MHIHILTSVWKRPQITRLFLKHFQELQKHVADGDALTMTMVHSKEDGYLIPDLFVDGELDGVLIEEHENQPLGAKWNWGLSQSRAIPYDYLMILGSDDFINPALLKWEFDQAKLGVDFAGVRDMWVVDSKSKKAAYWKGYNHKRTRKQTIGAGRLIKREILELVNWQLWSMDKRKGLDGSMGRMITPYLKQKGRKIEHLKMLNTDCRLFDLKSEVNMGAFNLFAQTKVDFDKFFTKHYTPELGEAIKAL